METVLIIAACVLSAAALVFALYLVLSAPRLRRPDMKRFCVPYAHRGLYSKEDGIPENSLSAFRKAAGDGRFGIELDIQLSSDGQVMVFHDYNLKRMCGEDKKLSELTAAELTSLSLDGTEQKIPLFSEVLEAIDGRVPVLVELKGESAGKEGNAALCREALRLIDEFGHGDYCFESFNPLLVAELKAQRPSAVRGQLITDMRGKKASGGKLRNLLLTALALNILAKPDFIAFDIRYKNLASVNIATKLFGAKRFVWTVRDRDSYKKCVDAGEYPIFEGFLPT